MGESEGDFLKIGDGLVDTIGALAGLEANAAVVDVGCGYGRLAHALLRSGFQGTYHGMDILRPHVEWAQRNLAGAGFDFSHLDIRNARYNPKGVLHATDVELHRHSPRCNIVVLTSVFTHMYQSEIENYFSCFRHMLRPDGKVICTFFLLNHERHRAIADGKSRLSLPHACPPVARYHNGSDPLHAIAFEERWVERLAEDSGLALTSRSYGYWCDGRATGGRQYQDFVALRLL